MRLLHSRVMNIISLFVLIRPTVPHPMFGQHPIVGQSRIVTPPIETPPGPKVCLPLAQLPVWDMVQYVRRQCVVDYLCCPI